MSRVGVPSPASAAEHRERRPAIADLGDLALRLMRRHWLIISTRIVGPPRTNLRVTPSGTSRTAVKSRIREVRDRVGVARDVVQQHAVGVKRHGVGWSLSSPDRIVSDQLRELQRLLAAIPWRRCTAPSIRGPRARSACDGRCRVRVVVVAKWPVKRGAEVRTTVAPADPDASVVVSAESRDERRPLVGAHVRCRPRWKARPWRCVPRPCRWRPAPRRGRRWRITHGRLGLHDGIGGCSPIVQRAVRAERDPLMRAAPPPLLRDLLGQPRDVRRVDRAVRVFHR